METYSLPTTWREKAREGTRHFVSLGGMPAKAPFGYRNVAEGARKKVAVVEEEARLVRLAFNLAAETDLPLRGILGGMRALGLAARTGGRMGLSTFWGMLTNPFYAGYVRYEGALVAGSHEPLVDEATFNRAQANLKGRKRSRRSSSVSPVPNKGAKKQAS